MKTTILATLLLSSTAFATNISFTYFGNEGGRQSYYACSYAEDQTISYLELLGATNIDVTCYGGISNGWSMQPVSVRASYNLPVVTGSIVETVTIEGDTFNPACGLNVRILKEVLKTFSNIEVLKKSDACAFAHSNYYYKLNIAR
ncbi:MAG: hypothetical protein H0V66_02730 [Bdellovibrionales bacterium]|nr:hypothetical protein [Bdellovibrionales bacterium]